MTDVLDFNNDIEGGQVLDFSDVPDSDQPLPPGIYGPASIVDAELKTSQAGNPYWNLRLRILEGEGVGRSLWHIITISPKTMSMVKRDFHRLGIDTTKPVPVNAELFLGRQCMLKVSIDEYDGQQRNKVKELIATDQGTVAAGSLF